MPIRYRNLENVQFYVQQNGGYKPLGYISDAEISVDDDRYSKEYLAYFSSEPIEFTGKIKGNLKAFTIFIMTGNDLYLRFPKKLRRRRNRQHG